MPPWARSGAGGSRTMKALGKNVIRHLPRDLQLSPARIEALLRSYLNAWAMYGLTLSDAAFFDDAPDSLRGIDAVKADALALHVQSIAVNHAGRAADVREGERGQEGQEGEERAHGGRIPCHEGNARVVQPIAKTL